MASIFSFLPESMRWLHATGKHDRAIKVISKIARFNGRPVPDITFQEIKTEKHVGRVHDGDPRLLFNTKRVASLSFTIGFAW